MHMVTVLINKNQPLPIQAVKNNPSTRLYNSLRMGNFISLKANPKGIIK